jgi:hypothetical protein
MNILSQSHTEAPLTSKNGGSSLVGWVRAHLTHIAEAFWFCLSFILFLILGPFSAIVVLIGLGSLASEENRERMTEPARL